jgi:nucleoid-associated protein YgaU
MAQGPLAEATITNLSDNVAVTCIFRPKEYTFAKQNQWTPGKAAGASMQPPKFNGGQPKTLNVELMFDSYETHKSTTGGTVVAGGTDVRIITGKLWKMMKVTPKRKDRATGKSEPPHVEFRWGRLWSFKAVITNISEKFTLFMPDGTPVRSIVTLQMLQAEDEKVWPGQNPTSGSREGYAMHQVTEGETIDWIAFVEYGSSTAWRHLAAANNLDDPGRLRPGQRLVVPPLKE